MYSLTIVVFAGAVALLVGLGAGLVLGGRVSADGRRLREVEHKLEQLTEAKRAYEEEVVAHFTQTAQLLNTLTDSYRDVHNHLARGAADLCQDRGPVPLERLGSVDDAEIPPHLASIQPPLDYAPKSSPEEKGMLDEEFGIERARNLEARTEQ